MANASYPVVQQTVVVDGALNGGVHGIPQQTEAKITRRRETIFGPDVGDDDQPGWVDPNEGNKVSVDTVKRWVEKAKSEEVRSQDSRLHSHLGFARNDDTPGAGEPQAAYASPSAA